MNLPKNVEYIITTLENAGFEGYAVGGCVRDTLLSKNPDDWDITTSASPEQAKKLFAKTIDTGIQHGTITVLLGKETYEVTTYRIDGEYEDRRPPTEVIFTSNLLEDLKRRDFTINAMAYNEKSGIVDEFGGMDDLENGIIRCVGNPKERFTEDALRMMRAVRFSGQLGYEIEDETANAVKELAPTLQKISAERICTELTKLMVSAHPEYLQKAYELGMTKVILPEFDAAMGMEQNNPHHMYSVGEHILHSMTQIRADKILRFTMLFHDLGKALTKTTDEEGIDHFHGHAGLSAEIADKVMKRLRFDNDTRLKVVKLVKYHDLKVKLTPKHVRKAIVTLGEDLFPLLLEVKRADFLAQSQYLRGEKEEELKELENLYKQILEENNCISLKDLAVTGSDLIQAGMKPGKAIGDVLQQLFEMVLEQPECNTKEYLMSQLPMLTEK
ncbi:MAG: CCA tRNA nucleotidyltransferase [Lachnospiraceae bacterium]|nr:CCA tRNA nucleotidyltransferase [Lachnospiraceae bacterium]